MFNFNLPTSDTVRKLGVQENALDGAAHALLSRLGFGWCSAHVPASTWLREIVLRMSTAHCWLHGTLYACSGAELEQPVWGLGADALSLSSR